jgi:hypothetical protein
MGFTWTFAVDESRVDENGVRMEDEVKPPKEMLTITGTEWELERGEFGSEMIAFGTIEPE